MCHELNDYDDRNVLNIFYTKFLMIITLVYETLKCILMYPHELFDVVFIFDFCSYNFHQNKQYVLWFVLFLCFYFA